MRGNKVKIRNYCNEDYSEVVSILKEASLFDEVWDSKENLKNLTILVAEMEKEIVGNIFIVPYGNKVSYMFRLAVKNVFREQGVGSALMEKAEELVKSKGSKEVGLYVDSGNANLQEFYKKKGFQISPKTYYYMWKSL